MIRWYEYEISWVRYSHRAKYVQVVMKADFDSVISIRDCFVLKCFNCQVQQISSDIPVLTVQLLHYDNLRLVYGFF